MEKAYPRTYNTETGEIVWLSRAEARKLRLPGHSTGRYDYSVDTHGRVERWVNGYGGWVRDIDPTRISQ